MDNGGCVRSYWNATPVTTKHCANTPHTCFLTKKLCSNTQNLRTIRLKVCKSANFIGKSTRGETKSKANQRQPVSKRTATELELTSQQTRVVLSGREGASGIAGCDTSAPTPVEQC